MIQRHEAFDLLADQSLFFLFPHTLINGLAGEILEQDRLVVVLQVTDQGMIRTDVEVSALQWIGGMLDSVLTIQVAHQDEQAVDFQVVLQDIGHQLQDLVHVHDVGDLF